ncbi:MAG: zf-HC2 domain-containing protein [Acidobacteriia bacterium]|nr:zf-HC2 domain-containing protein [Terriglobia bacterium]
MHPNETTIHDYVDDALDAGARAEVDRHLETCPACRLLVDDLRELRHVAGSLDLREPPARAWSRIERAIRLEPKDTRLQGARFGESRRARFASMGGARYAWLAAAAALVIATGVGLRFYTTHRPDTAAVSTTDGTAPAVASAAAQSIEAELREAESHYEKAIKGLEQITSSEQNTLDPGTAATLQKNLAVIDQAISESRAALHAQPDSEPAQQSLLDSFKTKIALLQDTVALINEMRKGNEAGAARIVSGLKPKG